MASCIIVAAHDAPALFVVSRLKSVLCGHACANVCAGCSSGPLPLGRRRSLPRMLRVTFTAQGERAAPGGRVCASRWCPARKSRMYRERPAVSCLSASVKSCCTSLCEAWRCGVRRPSCPELQAALNVRRLAHGSAVVGSTHALQAVQLHAVQRRQAWARRPAPAGTWRVKQA